MDEAFFFVCLVRTVTVYYVMYALWIGPCVMFRANEKLEDSVRGNSNIDVLNSLGSKTDNFLSL